MKEDADRLDSRLDIPTVLRKFADSLPDTILEKSAQIAALRVRAARLGQTLEDATQLMMDHQQKLEDALDELKIAEDEMTHMCSQHALEAF